MTIRRTQTQLAHISISVDFVRLVKIKAHKRVRKGKTQKVKSHYRRLRGI